MDIKFKDARSEKTMVETKTGDSLPLTGYTITINKKFYRVMRVVQNFIETEYDRSVNSDIYVLPCDENGHTRIF